ncbi:MAG: hypothetical protein HC767_11820 [Akkermansiaceae bacterium]|nr:hypothetical protein [Akkermansiaceae bacterium]
MELWRFFAVVAKVTCFGKRRKLADVRFVGIDSTRAAHQTAIGQAAFAILKWLALAEMMIPVGIFA